MKSRFQLHVERWGKGCGADCCGRATKVVLSRGKVPCDVLFVGEAPGKAENVLGRPFCGPAGHLLDRIIAKAMPSTMFSPMGEIRLAFTNLVGCIPLDEDGTKSGEPDVDSIEACAPRLQEFIDLASPRVVVCVGKLSSTWLKPGYKNPVTLPVGVKVVDLVHPAFILRQPLAQRGITEQQCIIRLSAALDELLEGRVTT